MAEEGNGHTNGTKAFASIVAIIGVISGIFLITRSVTTEMDKNTSLLSQRIEAIEKRMGTTEGDFKGHLREEAKQDCSKDVAHLKTRMVSIEEDLDNQNAHHASRESVEAHHALEGHVQALQRIRACEVMVKDLEKHVDKLTGVAAKRDGY